VAPALTHLCNDWLWT